MKPELSQSDKNSIEWSAKNDPVIKWIRNKNALSFQPGDILIKEEMMHSGIWQMVPVSPRSQVPKKYMFMYEDEYGIGYVKQLKAESAEYVHNITCLASIDHDRIRFQVDPEYATHILLNGEGTYDHSVEYKLVKERREKVRQENLKLLAKRNQNNNDVDAAFRSFVVGRKFWTAEDMAGTNRQELEVMNASLTKGMLGGEVCALMIREQNGTTRLLSCERFHGYVFKSKPWKLEDVL